MRKIVIAICGAALGVVLLAPSSASAVVTCNLAAEVLTITPDGTDTQVSIDRSGSAIRAFDGALGASADVCAGDAPTVSNTEEIDIDDTGNAGHDLVILVSLQGGLFAAGADTPPETSGPEIEIDAMAGSGTDTLQIEGGDGADDIDLGEFGNLFSQPVVNFNAAADGATRDCDDLEGNAIETILVSGRGGDDDINATACNGIGGATPLDSPAVSSLRLEGNNQGDFLRGGSGQDTGVGGTQDDNVIGGDGNDSIDGERDNDKVDGGAGADTIEGGTETDRVLYDDRTTLVTATIGNGGADDGGDQDLSGGVRDNIGLSVENLTGGSAGDSVTGSSARNVVNGGPGDDVLLGLGGNDDLEGEDGNDTADGGDGKDEVRGQGGTDTTRGGGGADQLFGGPLNDKLLGGNGGDVLKGDKGKDTFSGQGGNDKINAKDGARDKKISCGKGKATKESAKVDKQDPKAKSC